MSTPLTFRNATPYTLINLVTDYDVDTKKNTYYATFNSPCERAFTLEVSQQQFINYVGKLGRKFSADFKEVA